VRGFQLVSTMGWTGLLLPLAVRWPYTQIGRVAAIAVLPLWRGRRNRGRGVIVVVVALASALALTAVQRQHLSRDVAKVLSVTPPLLPGG
jgi:hypothetical protein